MTEPLRESTEKRRMPTLMRIRLAASLSMIAVFGSAIYAARDFPSLAGVYPRTVSGAGLVVAATTFVIDLRRWRSDDLSVSGEAGETSSVAVLQADGNASEDAAMAVSFRRAARYFGWILGYGGLLAVLGVVVATGVFVGLFLAVEARVRAVRALVVGALVAFAFMQLGSLLGLRWPSPLLSFLG